MNIFKYKTKNTFHLVSSILSLFDFDFICVRERFSIYLLERNECVSYAKVNSHPGFCLSVIRVGKNNLGQGLINITCTCTDFLFLIIMPHNVDNFLGFRLPSPCTNFILAILTQSRRKFNYI